MIELPDLTQLTDAQVLGLTGAGEARAELVAGKGWQPAPIANMVAVMWTPIHRVHADPIRFGADIADVCFEHSQYTCWNPGHGPGAGNHDWVIAQAGAMLRGRSVSPIVRQCVAVAEDLLAGALPDTVNRATHYYSPVSMVPPGRVPIWARGKTPCATIGEQFRFFRDV